jgi:hypothetical protein
MLTSPLCVVAGKVLTTAYVRSDAVFVVSCAKDEAVEFVVDVLFVVFVVAVVVLVVGDVLFVDPEVVFCSEDVGF